MTKRVVGLSWLVGVVLAQYLNTRLNYLNTVSFFFLKLHVAFSSFVLVVICKSLEAFCHLNKTVNPALITIMMEKIFL